MYTYHCQHVRNWEGRNECLLVGVYKIEQLVAVLLQWFHWCAVEGQHTCQPQCNIEGASKGGSMVFSPEMRNEVQKQKSFAVVLVVLQIWIRNGHTFEKCSYFDPSEKVISIIDVKWISPLHLGNEETFCGA